MSAERSIQQTATVSATIIVDLSVCIGCACILMLAALLEVNARGSVVVPLLELELPEACLWQRMVQMSCPGCGLTRGFIHLMNGDFLAAWRMNAAGWLVFLLIISQIPYRLLQLWKTYRGEERRDGTRWAEWAWLIPAALIGQWIVRSIMT